MGSSYDTMADEQDELSVTVDETTEKFVEGTLPDQYLGMEEGRDTYGFVEAIGNEEVAEELYSNLFDDGFFDAASAVAEEYDLGAVKQYGAKAVDMFENACIKFAGDRITALTHFTGALPFALGALGDEQMMSYGLFYFGMFGLFGYGVTDFGNFTKDAYKETEKHILENGELDPAYVEDMMEQEEWFEGYSREQGVYLAARKHDELETFNEVHSEVSSTKIPHF